MVSNNPLSNLDNLCENYKDSADLSGFGHVHFDKFGKVEKNKVEEAIYAMKEKFKTTPLEIANLEKKIRETSLAQLMLELKKVQISKAMKKYALRFVPKYKAFNILQNNIEDVVKKNTKMWKLTYGLKIVKE